MHIRKETATDYEIVYSVVKRAFENAEHADGNEQDLVNALIQEGHKIAKELGYTHAIVLGSEKYYPKSGYSPAEGFGIKAPFDAPSENFMACVLSETDVEIHGTIKYAPEFGIE